MILIQTAFAQESAAVAACFSSRESNETDRQSLVTSSALRCRNHWQGHIAAAHCLLIQTGIGASAARRSLGKALEQIETPSLVLSIGFAGALSTRLRVGDRCPVARVLSDDPREPRLLVPSLNRLRTSRIGMAGGSTVVTVAQPVLTASAKRLLAERTGADLCDMETHAVADVCVAHDLPWLAARMVSDGAGESLSPWIVSLPDLIERRRWWHVGRLIASHPKDLPALIGLGMRMRKLQRELSQFTVELISNVVES